MAPWDLVSSLSNNLARRGLAVATVGRAAGGEPPAAARDKARQRPAGPSPTAVTAGTALFAALIFVCGARPQVLPWVMVAFAAVGLPARAFRYLRVEPANSFFLLDFCYAVNAATALHLLVPALRGPRLEAAVYALADGPVAGALVVWQCAWVFPSAEHTLSTLLHLLPGLAMAAQRHGARAGEAAGAEVDNPVVWLLLAPLGFYATWQLLYWLVVQVVCSKYIQRHGYDTSYRCLARRAKRADNFWSRLVLRGSTARRLAMYGAVQLVFTVATLLAVAPTYYCRRLALLWQAAKFLLPLYHGARYQCAQQQRRIKMAVAEQQACRYHLTADARPCGCSRGGHGCEDTAPAS